MFEFVLARVLKCIICTFDTSNMRTICRHVHERHSVRMGE